LGLVSPLTGSPGRGSVLVNKLSEPVKRAFSYILMILGIYLLIDAGCQEFRGVTVRPLKYLPFSRRAILDHRHHGYYLFRVRVFKRNNPELFREFMDTHWLYAVLIEVWGILLCATQYRLPEPSVSDA
jgi:hypothetical protein